MKTSFAFPKITIDRIFSPWVKAVNSRECISVLNIPKRDQLYRVNELLKRQTFNKKIQIITLDLKGQIIEDSSDLELYLNKYAKISSKQIVLLILDADQLLDEKIAILSCLDKIYFDRKNYSLIYLFQKNITSSEKTKKLSRYTSLFQNISVFSYFNPKDMEFFLEYIENSYKINIPKNIEKNMLDRCGGAPWLIKESVRYFAQTQDEKNIFDHDNMKLKAKIIYQELSAEEKIIVEKIIRNNYLFSNQEKTIINYLLRTKLIVYKNQKYDITIPILEDTILEILNEKTQLTLNPGGQLIINNVLIEGFFSRREKRVIKLFLENKEKVLIEKKLP